MNTLQDYRDTLEKNRQLSPGNDYAGYWSQDERITTGKSLAGLREWFNTAAKKLEEDAPHVAQHEPIESVNYVNTLKTQLRQTGQELAKETQENHFYKLKEISIYNTFELIRLDKQLIQTYHDFHDSMEHAIEEKMYSKENLGDLLQEFNSLKSVFNERRELITEIAETDSTLQKQIQYAGNLIDKRNIQELSDAVDTIFETGRGRVNPFLDLLDEFKEHQLFIYRRAERSIERDEEAIKFFEIFANVLDRLQLYTESDELLSQLPHFEKLRSSIEMKDRIIERRDKLIHISGMKDHRDMSKEKETDEENVSEKTGKQSSTTTYFIVGSVIVLLIIVVLVFAM
ncbi:MAG: hypothetical protein K9N46_01985 [Candidatus Marinimicrobia bacterium]|nr:hypothetical protein [Candidatus Neomarinimicrobiota bacterium]MCF7828333.1 hypothetical protein [Candidatus Neomarinimicrobiota bacterium]MCF7879492.1 hypothetical protein [Candidatus Neomarinimicrobiota bacterium]